MAIYLKLDPIKGSVTDSKFKEQIELDSFQWGAGVGVGAPPGGGPPPPPPPRAAHERHRVEEVCGREVPAGEQGPGECEWASERQTQNREGRSRQLEPAGRAFLGPSILREITVLRYPGPESGKMQRARKRMVACSVGGNLPVRRYSRALVIE
jgi:hypothetical protein